ncbi:MAG: hypothetical protein IPK86_04230 [Neisseriales bacterium]|nr:MAG: hypothetical protein IPK86_04230 [Neisseriales bacterium]
MRRQVILRGDEIDNEELIKRKIICYALRHLPVDYSLDDYITYDLKTLTSNRQFNQYVFKLL